MGYTLLITFFLQCFLLLLHTCFSLQHSHKVGVTSFLASNVCNQSTKGFHKQGSSLKVMHKYGPCIEKQNNDTRLSTPNQEEMFLQDQLRVDSMHTRFSKNSGKFKEMKTNLPLRSGISLGTGDYVVTVGIGSPRKDLTLVFDTGSDITWTQCQPCVGSCYKQSEPIFDPRKSSSYKNVSCSSSYCKLLRSSGTGQSCSSSTCTYRVSYGDGSTSIGFFATEKLTIASSVVFNGFYFGCGQQNSGRLGQTTGLLALGPNKLSFPLQTANKFKKIFSYCIPSSSSETGHLSFAEKFPKNVKFTPSSPDFEDSPYYGIDIDGIKVGGDKLDIDDSVFIHAGAIIDSGTVITRLQPTAYSALRSAFQEFMKDYPKTKGFSILDTCYDFSDYDEIVIPKISIMFKGGVELEIVPLGILLATRGVDQLCLAFAPNDDDSDFAIIGNAQQKTYEIVHDLGKERIGFSPNGCN
ncbi:aspartyl protease family protein At5g10770-like [Euphorbia lathyris]|uniref:aspartyl protease family protein At5g10770-like n=1 Tax=Euphorbia lathyris TaxID=212925 RepID=UPI0033135BFD